MYNDLDLSNIRVDSEHMTGSMGGSIGDDSNSGGGGGMALIIYIFPNYSYYQ
jgi:hypothetical protein